MDIFAAIIVTLASVGAVTALIGGGIFESEIAGFIGFAMLFLAAVWRIITIWTWAV